MLADWFFDAQAPLELGTFPDLANAWEWEQQRNRERESEEAAKQASVGGGTAGDLQKKVSTEEINLVSSSDDELQSATAAAEPDTAGIGARGPPTDSGATAVTTLEPKVASAWTRPSLRRRFAGGFLAGARSGEQKQGGAGDEDVAAGAAVEARALSTYPSLLEDSSGEGGSEASTTAEPEAALVRGRVFLIKGWWRKGPKLAERFMEIRREPGGDRFLLLRCRFARDDELDPTSVRRLCLAGVAVEAIDMPEHADLYCLRVYFVDHEESPLDLGLRSGAERSEWLAAIGRASRHTAGGGEDAGDGAWRGGTTAQGQPLAAQLRITLAQADVVAEQQPILRRSVPEFFAVVRHGGMASRTVPKRPPGSETAGSIDFAWTLEFPILDDDPDSLVVFEIWSTVGKWRSRLRGQISVPLYCFGRNAKREFRLPLRDPSIPGRGAESSAVGTIQVDGMLSQPLESLFLPRPARRTTKSWQSVGEKPLREQLKELEEFLQDFEVFSSRFVHHCDTWRQISLFGRDILQWDRPLVTMLLLMVTTVVVAFFHEHIVPLVVLVIFLVTAWLHPWSVKCRRRCMARWAARPRLRATCSRLCCPRCCRQRKFRLSWSPFGRRASLSKKEAALSGLKEAALSGTPCSSASSTSGVPRLQRAASLEPTNDGEETKERFENERRLMLGKFCAQRLRFYDPPAWCDAEGRRAEPATAGEDPVTGAHTTWRVDVNPFTDSDGWRYARNFGKSSIWRSAFHPASSFVRCRRHIGRTVPGPGPSFSAPSFCAASASNDKAVAGGSSITPSAAVAASGSGAGAAGSACAPALDSVDSGSAAVGNGPLSSFVSSGVGTPTSLAVSPSPGTSDSPPRSAAAAVGAAVVAAVRVGRSLSVGGRAASTSASPSGQTQSDAGGGGSGSGATGCLQPAVQAASATVWGCSGAAAAGGARPGSFLRFSSPTLPQVHDAAASEAQASLLSTARAGPKGPELGLAKTPFHDMYQQCLMRWAYLQRQIEYWMDWYERRKNLFVGTTLDTQNFALAGIFALLGASLVLPTRVLVLAGVYVFFWDGLLLGRLMRRHRNVFIDALRANAASQWLPSEGAEETVAKWGYKTSLDDITDAGVPLLALRDWIRTEFYDGRPMIPLRAVQRCGTLGELAAMVIWTSDRFARQRQRKRVWYKSTMRNLLDHVPTDITMFQPMICQGLGDGSLL